MHPFEQLLEIKSGEVLVQESPAHCAQARMVVAPDLGGRLFVEVAGQSMHRMDLEVIKRPNQPFNNFGGMNLWPAPEGGDFGFNYHGDQWIVQPAINQDPFQVVESRSDFASLRKRCALVNRKKKRVEVEITREVRIVEPAEELRSFGEAILFAVETNDGIKVENAVSMHEALIAAWNLEQFDATENTMAFVSVENPRAAINFDFYQPSPQNLITWHEKGFTFRVHGRQRGQIGIRASAHARRIGFYDLSRKILCLKELTQEGKGTYFNIADNDQPQGPYSAADNYSIFNSDTDMQAFELETIAPVEVTDKKLRQSRLSSKTTYSVFSHEASIQKFLMRELGASRE